MLIKFHDLYYLKLLNFSKYIIFYFFLIELPFFSDSLMAPLIAEYDKQLQKVNEQLNCHQVTYNLHCFII